MDILYKWSVKTRSNHNVSGPYSDTQDVYLSLAPLSPPTDLQVSNVTGNSATVSWQWEPEE